LGATTSFDAGWVKYSFTFTATDITAALDFIEFAPIDSGFGSAYPGLDLVSLIGPDTGSDPNYVPEPTTIILVIMGLVLMRSKRSKV